MMAAETTGVIILQVFGGVTVLSAIFYIIHLTARYDVEIGDRYREDADRNRLEADKAREEAEKARQSADELREKLAETENEVQQAKKVLDAVHKDTIAINTAVNHKETGMPTLVQRVANQDEHSIQLALDLASHREWLTSKLNDITDQLESLLTDSLENKQEEKKI